MWLLKIQVHEAMIIKQGHGVKCLTNFPKKLILKEKKEMQQQINKNKEQRWNKKNEMILGIKNQLIDL